MKKPIPPLPADLVRKLDEQGSAHGPATKSTDPTVIDARFDAVTVVAARFDDITVVAAKNVTQPQLANLDSLDNLDSSEVPMEESDTTPLARLAHRPRVPLFRYAWPPAWVVVLTAFFFFAVGAVYWQMHWLLKVCSPCSP